MSRDLITKRLDGQCDRERERWWPTGKRDSHKYLGNREELSRGGGTAS